MERIHLDKKITLRLDGDLVDRLQDRATRQRVPLSFILRNMVIRYLEAPKEADDPAAPCPAGGSWRGKPDVEKHRREFRETICDLFDGFISQGLDVKEATRRTNFAMKGKRHPWATFDVIARELRHTGRFRKTKGHPQG